MIGPAGFQAAPKEDDRTRLVSPWELAADGMECGDPDCPGCPGPGKCMYAVKKTRKTTKDAS